MTNGDIMTTILATILAEVTGRPAVEVGAVVRTARLLSGADGLDVEVTDDDAARLLAALLSRLESLKLAIGNATYLDECMFSVDALQRMLDHIRDAGQGAK